MKNVTTCILQYQTSAETFFYFVLEKVRYAETTAVLSRFSLGIILDSTLPMACRVCKLSFRALRTVMAE